jgi:hypothetical protein
MDEREGEVALTSAKGCLGQGPVYDVELRGWR